MDFKELSSNPFVSIYYLNDIHAYYIYIYIDKVCNDRQSDSLDEIRGVNLLGNPIMCGACVVRFTRACVL